MSGLPDLWRRLPQTAEQELHRLLVGFEQAAVNLQPLEAEFERVREQLDVVNQERDQLRIEKEAIDRVVRAIDDLESNDVAVVELRMILTSESWDRAARIAQLRPDDLHAQKADLKAQIDRRRRLARLAAMIAKSSHGNR